MVLALAEKTWINDGLRITSYFWWTAKERAKYRPLRIPWTARNSRVVPINLVSSLLLAYCPYQHSQG